VTIEARYPEARWRGPVPNKVAGGMAPALRGLVLHVEQGGEPGTDSWFHNPGSEVSAHTGAPTADTLGESVPLDQWVDFDDRAWAEANGNSRWLSVETAGFATDPMDSSQLHEIAKLYAWLHGQAPESFPFRTSNSVTESGFGWHGMGGAAWGGHLGCPGDKRKAQRAVILAKAITLVHPKPAHTPHHSGEPSTPAYPGILEEGTTGKGVEELTGHLRGRGWAIKKTGVYSVQVRDVVSAFQDEKHLHVDGIVGPATWWAVWHLPVTS
jgi:hypothetical protein